MRPFILIVILLSSATYSFASSATFEYQIIEMENGTAYYAWVNYDESADKLLVKYTEEGSAIILNADEVTRFSFQNQDFISLTFLNKFNTFYKVKFEANNVALLEKKPTVSMLRLLAEANELVYFEKHSQESGSETRVYFQHQSAGNILDAYAPSAKEENAIEIESLLFLATPQKFDLFITETNQFTAFWENYWQHQPSGRQVKKLLAPYISSDEVLNKILNSVNTDNLDLRNTDQLITALKQG